MSPRRRRWARDAAAMAGLVALLAALNWWTGDHDPQIDLSARHRFSLSADTRRLLGQVTSPLRITVFTNSTASATADARFLLARYHELNHRITFRVADPDTDPALARRYGVTSYETVVVEYRGRRVDAPDPLEGDLSAAMLEALQGSPVTVCVLTGHGEDDLEKTSPSGFSSVAKLLKDNDYTVRPFDLTTGSSAGRRVPADCAAVMIDGARDPLLPGERDAINAYAAGGGRLAVLATPLSNDDPNPIINPWGVRFVGGLVIDPDRAVGTDLSNLVVEDLPSLSPVDVGVTRVEFPAPGALEIGSDAVNGLTVEDLAATSAKSYVAPNPSAQITYQQGDRTGPVVVAAAADASRVVPAPQSHVQRTRVFVTGTDLWATNQFLDALSNRRLLVNAMAWLTGRDQLLVVTTRPPIVDALPFTAARQREAIAIVVLLVPGALLGAGGARALMRRRRMPRGT